MRTIVMKRIQSLLLMLAMSVGLANANGQFKIVEGISDNQLKATMESNVNEMLSLFNEAANLHAKNIKLSKEKFTNEAVKEIGLIWKGSAMVFPSVNIMSRCLKTSRGYQVRGIPIDIEQADDNEKRQELTIDFLTNGKICNVAIAIDMNRYEQIMAEKSSDIDYARRQVIIDFVENFRTAYNRKDIKLLNSVFSDKALIITGKVITEKPNSDMDRLTLRNNKVVYIKQTKQQYWHTSHYSDEGYLFLMIDFRDANNPLIQVRTWQPYKNNVGQVITKKEDVYHLGSFRIVR